MVFQLNINISLVIIDYVVFVDELIEQNDDCCEYDDQNVNGNIKWCY